jgi:phosphoribosyl 1,2-cyclic phosphodiesterase
VARGLRRALGDVRAWTLGSGSRGNGLVLESGGRYLLVDCGFGPRALATRLKAIGVNPEEIEALVITHEHVDHASGAERAQHKWRWPVFASAGTLRAMPDIEAKWRRPVAAGASINTDGFRLEAVAIPHDAASPLAFAVTGLASGARVGIAHDLGAVPDAVRTLFARCDALCLEANHNVEMLVNGPYPAMLKARIRGGRGHIDNKTSGTLAASLLHPGLRALTLLHLSETNNTPKQAEEEVGAIVRRAGFRGPVLAAAGRTPALAFQLGNAAPRQLALAL